MRANRNQVDCGRTERVFKKTKVWWSSSPESYRDRDAGVSAN